MTHPRLPRLIFLLAGTYGLLALVPQYFLFDHIGRTYPPAINHPEYFYGFIGVATAWQLAFLLIATHPARYRPMMPVAIVEKLSFAVPAWPLFLTHQIPTATFAVAQVDLLLGCLFALAYRLTRPTPSPESQIFG